MNWVLILFVTVGPLSDKDSMALTSVPGFVSQAACSVAGSRATSTFATGTKRASFVCVKTTNE